VSGCLSECTLVAVAVGVAVAAGSGSMVRCVRARRKSGQVVVEVEGWGAVVEGTGSGAVGLRPSYIGVLISAAHQSSAHSYSILEDR